MELGVCMTLILSAENVTVPAAGLIFTAGTAKPVNLAIANLLNGANTAVSVQIYNHAMAQTHDITIAYGTVRNLSDIDLNRIDIAGAGAAITLYAALSPEVPQLNTTSANVAATNGLPATYNNTFGGGAGIAVSPAPAGYRWRIRGMTLSWTAASTITDYPKIAIYPTDSTVPSAGDIYILYLEGISVTASANYAIYLSEFAQARSGLINTVYQYGVTINSEFFLYPNETISVLITNENNNALLDIEYIQEQLS